MMSLIGSIVGAIMRALFEAFASWRNDQDRIKANREAAVNSAALETQEAINEIADARSKLPAGGSADALAARLRSRKGARNFGGPGRLEGGDKGEDSGGLS
jgi:hypothetical protein